MKGSGKKRNAFRVLAATAACFWSRISRSFLLTFVASKVSSYLGLIFFSTVFLREKNTIIERPLIICYLFRGEQKLFSPCAINTGAFV